jgi:hypothetical protein
MSEKCCCGTHKKDKVVLVEYLYLDLNTCQRCVGTDAVLEEVLRELTPAFELAGYRIVYDKIEIESKFEAVFYKFESSPTIRVNGIDICESVHENDCGCCGEISGTQTNCRVFSYEGKLYEVPPRAMVAEAILKNAFRTAQGSGRYVLSENLKNFFEGKAQKSVCCCSGSSCC